MNLLVNGDPQVWQEGSRSLTLVPALQRIAGISGRRPQNEIKLGIGDAAPGAAGTIEIRRPGDSASVGRMSLYQILPTLESLKLQNWATFTCWIKVGADWTPRRIRS